MLWLTLISLGRVQADPALQLTYQSGVPYLNSTAHAGQVIRLEHSDDLREWTECARVFDRLQAYPDWQRAGRTSAFYRLQAWPKQDADDWANQLSSSASWLSSAGSGSRVPLASVKCLLLLQQPDRVYFQDPAKYPYHIQFARARLPGYAGIGTLDFNAQALYANAAQRMVVGAVLRAPDPQVRELGLEVTGAEAFPAARAVEWTEAIRRRLVLEPGWRVFYIPSTEQREETEAHAPLFAARGLEVASLSRWVTAHVCYSPGWALGRLVHVPSGEITAALGDGRLRFGDILVTDHIPAELPVLAGYLSLQPATPNSHVALLARSLLLPFAHANGAGLQAEIASLNGREVLLLVSETNGVGQIQLQDATDRLTPEQRKEILDRKRGGAIGIVPKATAGSFTLPADPLTPADLRYVGGKAANFGFLRRCLPDTTPSPALAITFDLWDEYLAQPLADGTTLGRHIAERLSRHIYPPNVTDLRADLAAVRDTVESVADFTAAQKAAIVAALRNTGLQGAKIRFRSSTNVEDGESFSGAGLYDSFSGCLEDDTDADTRGPSGCDPTERNERGVFRAMRKVYASFYNENAFLERLRHSVKETDVGMAILVHFSVPDANEMANGVATLAVTKTNGTRTATARIVTQLGAESVTNPDVTVRPEVVGATYTGSDANAAELRLEESSTLTTDGAPVMTWETDYRTLLKQLNTATLAYEQYYPSNTVFELDFEFKRLVPGRVGLKQMRAVPHPVPVPPPVLP